MRNETQVQMFFSKLIDGCEEGGCLGGNTFSTACEAEVFGCGRFDGDRFNGQREVFGDVLDHQGDVREELGRLGYDCHVDIDG